MPARALRHELLLVLGVSLGASAVRALVSFAGVVTRPGGLSEQAANLNTSRAPDRPWLDLAWQLVSISTALVPVLLVAHLLLREYGYGGPDGRPGQRGMRLIGFDLTRPRFDLAWGAVVAAGIGGSGLALYLGAHAAGANLTVVPESLPEVWWKYPVLIASAVQNSVVEEVIVVGFLLRRLDQLGWSATGSLAASALLRGAYHLYQGIGGFFGNVAMGVIFVWLYRRWGRVMPLVVAHALIDIVAFVGYGLLAGRVDWLPTL
ncbi:MULTISPECIES: CPBP family intramembrane glutamic endopeptidase [Streptomyces]|uniref:CPBP family intramembrane glutamic endopeptidase n=1 Tax=Streptomyces TaxID=1883 RepID=UPI00186B3EF0|nr:MULTISPECIES: CPBP family intramembrane glutamic endopeptidase [Streptomyces]